MYIYSLTLFYVLFLFTITRFKGVTPKTSHENVTFITFPILYNYLKSMLTALKWN